MQILFTNLGQIIEFLLKNGSNNKGSASDTEGEGSDCDPKDGYYAIKNILVDKIYASFFSADRYEDALKKDL
jgi:hypothetical protein